MVNPILKHLILLPLNKRTWELECDCPTKKWDLMLSPGGKDCPSCRHGVPWWEESTDSASYSESFEPQCYKSRALALGGSM